MQQTQIQIRRPVLVGGVAVMAILLAACGGSTTPASPGAFVPDNGTSPIEANGLARVGNKDEFAASIRAALLNQFSDNVSSGIDDSTDAVFAEADVQTTAISVSASASAQAESTSSDAREVTGTNVQEIGVDEQDRIKVNAAGSRLYVLDNTYRFGAEPLPEVTSFAADSLPYNPQVQSRVRIMSLDADGVDATEVSAFAVSIGNESIDGMYLNERNGGSDLILTSSSLQNYWGVWDSSYAFYQQSSSIKKFDVSDASAAVATGELRLDGQIVSSRRIGNYLYVASRYYPEIPGIDPWSVDRATLESTVDATDIDTLLPSVTEGDGNVTALADANNCFVPAQSERSFYSADIVTLSAIDLTDLSVADSICFLGSTETLYASTEGIFLATTRYDYRHQDQPVTLAIDPDDAVISEADIAFYDPQIETDIHQFSINGGALTYDGSGSVSGHLGWSYDRKPFRMSYHNGYLRVATMSGVQSTETSPVLVSVLKADGNGSLQRVAELPNAQFPAHIGKPREELYASRFLGDKGYLVTFRQTDPLYVIDFADPENPVVAGELEIPGYSDYLQAVGENHLIGIGRGAIAAAPDANGAERGAFVQGVKMSLFDVSDPANPVEVNSVDIGKRGTYAEALNDHHGVTVQLGNDQQPTRVTFGINVAEGPARFGEGPSAWHDWTYTGLHGFEVTTGVNAAVSFHGSMVVEQRSDAQLYYSGSGGDRSVIAGDTVFYVHGIDVYAARWDSLADYSGPR